MTNDWPPEIHQYMHALADATPPAPRVEHLDSPTPAPSRSLRPIAALALAPLAIGTIVAVAVLTDRESDPRVDDTPAPTAPPASASSTATSETTMAELVRVRHDRVRSTITSELQCDTPISTDGKFSTATIDVYADVAGRRWKMVFTYPDGSTRETIALGSVVYPTALWTRGTLQSADPGCVGPDDEPFILVAEPGQNTPYSPTGKDIAEDEWPYVAWFFNFATKLEQPQPDFEGKSSIIWQHQIYGTAGYGTSNDRALHQTTTWWVDPSDDTTVTQVQFENTVEGLGTARSTQTVLSTSEEDLASDVFDTAGYVQQPAMPRPTEPGPFTAPPPQHT